MSLAYAVNGKEAVMRTLLGIVIASAPFAVVFGLLAWADYRDRRRRDVAERQIALTDSIHERLGAQAAPVVRRRGRRWQVRVAVPFERPTLVRALLAIVRETFVGDPRSLEIVLTRQSEMRLTKASAGRGVEWESLSWT
jgi:hypothetical protein